MFKKKKLKKVGVGWDNGKVISCVVSDDVSLTLFPNRKILLFPQIDKKLEKSPDYNLCVEVE